MTEKTLTSSDVLKKEQCSRKSTYDKFERTGDYPASIRVKYLVEDFIRKELKVDSATGATNAGDFDFPKDLYETKELYEAHRQRAISALSFFSYTYRNVLSSAKFDVKKEVEIAGVKVTLTCDMLYKDQRGRTTAVNFHFEKPKLTRSGKNRVVDSLEAKLLWLLANEFADEKGAKSEIFYMIPKDYKLAEPCGFDENSMRFTVYSMGIPGTNFVETIKNDVAKVIRERSIKTIECKDCTYNYFCNYVKEVEAKEIKEKDEKKTFSVDEDQLKVAMFKKGIARVIAGPGSGKTKTITSRVSYLTSTGVKPEELLLFTFTNAAADEMKERVIKILKEDKLNFKEDDLLITTFHGLGYKIISEHYKTLGYTEPPTQVNKTQKYEVLQKIYTEIWDYITEDQKSLLIRECRGLNPIYANKYIKGYLNLVDEDISSLKSESLILNEDVVLQNINFTSTLHLFRVVEVLKIFYDKYNEYLVKNNLVDYDDLIKLPLRHPELYRESLPHLKHIIVDEFQDSNKLQMGIIKKLTELKGFESLMVVGDPSQAIYGFQGTSPKNFIEFKDFFKGQKVEDFILHHNYRSTKEIIEVSEAIETLQIDSIEKKMVTDKHGNVPALITNGNSVNEVVGIKIADEIRDTEYKDICIIGRTKKSLKDLESYLSKFNIPFMYGINEEVSQNEFLEPVIDFGNTLKTPNDNGYLKYLAMTNRINPEMEKEEVAKEIEKVKKEIEEKIVIKDGYPTDESLKSTFSLFIEDIKDKRMVKYLKEKEKQFKSFKDLIEYLESAALYGTDEILEPLNDGKNAVTLVTAHSAKGREWKNVHILLDSFSVPAWRAKLDEKKLQQRDEEIRVVYVAATRAKDELTIYASKGNDVTELLLDLSKVGQVDFN